MIQGRILRKPIEERKFKLLCEYLLQHLPERITIDGNKWVDIASIQFFSTFAGSGLADKDKRPIFVQIYSLPQPLQYITLRYGLYTMLLTAIPYEQFHQIIAGLPNDWRSDYLRCLNLNPKDLAIFQRLEDAVVQQIRITEIQQRKTISTMANSVNDLDLLDHNCGIFYLQVHQHLESWLFLCDRMQAFARKNVSICYIEMAKLALDSIGNTKPLFFKITLLQLIFPAL